MGDLRAFVVGRLDQALRGHRASGLAAGSRSHSHRQVAASVPVPGVSIPVQMPMITGSRWCDFRPFRISDERCRLREGNRKGVP